MFLEEKKETSETRGGKKKGKHARMEDLTDTPSRDLALFAPFPKKGAQEGFVSSSGPGRDTKTSSSSPSRWFFEIFYFFFFFGCFHEPASQPQQHSSTLEDSVRLLV
jgi:hypothetical protein